MRIKWSRRARADQQRIWLFLVERSEAYADRVETLVEERVKGLSRFPHLGRLIPGTSARRLSITEVQYIVDYQIESTEEDMIRILRVRSTRENRDES